MYKFTFYFKENDDLRQIGDFALSYEDAMQYLQIPLQNYTQEGFEKAFTHRDEHPCTLKQGGSLRLRITKES